MDSLERLRWRCRRGMKELDLLLLRFLERAGQTLSNDELQALARLLDFPDDVLLNLLMGRTITSDRDIANVIDKVRNAATRNT